MVPCAARRSTDSVASAISSDEPSVAARPHALRRREQADELRAKLLVVVLPAVEQIALEAEQPDFLDEGVGRQQRSEVVLMARVGRAAPHHAVALRAEAAGHDHAGNAGEQDERQHLPAEPRHQAADRRQRDQRLADADHLEHDAERARADFVVRVAQRVVGLGVFEALDVERCGFVENPKADAVLQRVAEQLARRAVDGLNERRARSRCRPAARAASPALRYASSALWKPAGDRARDFVDAAACRPTASRPARAPAGR